MTHSGGWTDGGRREGGWTHSSWRGGGCRGRGLRGTERDKAKEQTHKLHCQTPPRCKITLPNYTVPSLLKRQRKTHCRNKHPSFNQTLSGEPRYRTCSAGFVASLLPQPPVPFPFPPSLRPSRSVRGQTAAEINILTPLINNAGEAFTRK